MSSFDISRLRTLRFWGDVVLFMLVPCSAIVMVGYGFLWNLIIYPDRSQAMPYRALWWNTGLTLASVAMVHVYIHLWRQRRMNREAYSKAVAIGWIAGVVITAALTHILFYRNH